MAASIPTSEPSIVTAGDLVTWTKSLSDYPANESWVLTYAWRGGSALSVINLTATASGADHLISVTAATTAAWLAGLYSVQGYVTKAAERYTVFSGQIEIQPNLFAATSALETRSWAKICLDNIDAVLSGSATKAQFQSAAVEGGMSFGRMSFKELREMREYFAGLYATELAIETGGVHTKIYTKFTAPS